MKKPAVTKTVNSVAKGIAKVPAVTKPAVRTVAKSIAAGAAASIITAKQTTPIVSLKAQSDAVKAAEAAKQAAAIAKGKEYAKKAAERTAGLLSDLSKVQCNPSENNTGFTSNNALEKGANTLFAFFTSMTLDAGIGAGIGFEGAVGPFKGEILGASDIFAVRADYENGFVLGRYERVGASLSLPAISIGGSTGTFYPEYSWPNTGEPIYEDADTGLLGINLGAYAGIGGHFSVGWDTSKFLRKAIEIWSQ